MKAIYKKELRGLMTSMTGYVFIAFLLAVCGIYFTAYHLQGAYPVFAYTLESVLFVFLIAVPVLTMRVLAEERKLKTDQLLLTAPVTVAEIVLGKYMALVSVYAIASGVLSVYPLIMTQFGTVSMGESYTALLGFFLMGSCFLAMGLYLSSVTESQVIAAVLTFLVLFACYVMDGIASFFPETASASFFTMLFLVAILAAVLYFMVRRVLAAAAVGIAGTAVLTILYAADGAFYEGLIQSILGALSVSEHFAEFAQGIFDVTGIVYYVSVAAVFLFLAVQSIQKRRWS